MRVRHACAADRDFIVALAGRFAEFDLPPWLDGETVSNGTAAQLRRALDMQSDRSAVLLAESDAGVALGFAWVLLVDDFYGGKEFAKISEIAVARDNAGAGSALMQASEAWARERGCDRVVLNVMEGNLRARRFYDRLGFEPEYTMLVKTLG